ncbi:hypothetical protein SDC9_169053 [bioreactor metagenome]|uniref:Uncharacterized protein n=1 Tax=bioreactor metagenome TaxID=1076179 RepID=A0A645GCU0_9ZZZZ
MALQIRTKVIKNREFSFIYAGRFLLRTRKELNPLDIDKGGVISVRYDLPDNGFIHAKLVSVCQAKQNPNGQLELCGKAINELPLGKRFDGIDNSIAVRIHRVFNIIRVFIYAGHDYFICFDIGALANMKFTGRADLIIINQVLHFLDDKRISLHGVAQFHIRTKRCPDFFYLNGQCVRIKKIERRFIEIDGLSDILLIHFLFSSG